MKKLSEELIIETLKLFKNYLLLMDKCCKKCTGLQETDEQTTFFMLTSKKQIYS